MGNQPRAEFCMYTLALPKSLLSFNTAVMALGTFEFGLFHKKKKKNKRKFERNHRLPKQVAGGGGRQCTTPPPVVQKATLVTSSQKKTQIWTKSRALGEK